MSADAKYFSNSKRGELAELRDELNSKEKDVKKDAVKKVIAAMTVGKDVSGLFTEVLNCMVTTDLELKKLVYLYLMNYAKAQPELAILAVNAFVKDTRDVNPLIRALAIRTMSSIRVEEIVNYLVEPLRKSIKDDDPYVRKTAAISIAKLHDVDPELVADQGFLDDLRDMLGDSNPMVVANAVAALKEISATDPAAFDLSAAIASKLLAALPECTEWGRTFLLDALVRYTPEDSKEAESIVERVLAQLSHANSGVVLSACKVIIRMFDFIEDPDYITSQCKTKLAPALVTLLSAQEAEVQYVALRNIIIVLQKLPALLAEKDIRVFICKYNDPIYVKMEKLEIMILLANPTNVVQVLQELKDSAQEVDVDFVRKAVRAIGRCAIKLDEAADRCINVLLELIQTKVTYVVQEAIVVIKDIFRKYPNRYESVIGALCENLESLDEPDAKAALFWIIGEYAERIDNAGEILEAFVDTFTEEPAEVQLQYLTAVVKLFICAPDESSELMRRVLGMATQSDNPDLRDRGYVYWRLLSSDPATARDVVMAEKPVIASEAPVIDPALLPTLVLNISTLASVYHKLPETFVSKLKTAVLKTGAAIKDNEEDIAAAVARVRVTNDDDYGPTRESSNTLVDDMLSGAVAAPPRPAGGAGTTGLEDLLGMGMGAGVAPTAHVPSGGSGSADLLGGDLLSAPVQRTAAPAATAAAAAAPAAAAASAPQTLLLEADKGDGMELRGGFSRVNNAVVLSLTISNKSAAVLSQFMVQFNVNSFGLAPRSTKMDINSVLPHGSAACSMTCAVTPNIAPGAPSRTIQVAVKNNVKVYFFAVKLGLDAVSLEGGRLAKGAFQSLWRSIPETAEQQHTVSPLMDNTPDGVSRRLEAKACYFVARTEYGGNDMSYYSMKLIGDVTLLVEVTLTPGGSSAKVCVKSAPEHAAFAPLMFDFLSDVLSQ